VIDAPFRADDAAARRLAGLAATIGPEIEAALREVVAASVPTFATAAESPAASTVPAAHVAGLVDRLPFAGFAPLPFARRARSARAASITRYARR